VRAAKAIWGAVVAFVAPGATVLLTELAGDGIQSGDWLKAGLVCVVSAAAVGGAVWAAPKNAEPTNG
jgi:hypothetical protein